MIPTSLEVAGFQPAEGNLSSQTSTFGSSSQKGASEERDGGSNFRQVMNSYTRSEPDHTSSESKPAEPASRPTDDGKAARPKDDTNNNNTAAAPDQPASSSPARSFTGVFGFGKADPQEQQTGENAVPADTNATAGAAVTPQTAPSQAATPQAGSARQFADLSVFEMLLKGGSLTQLVASANGPAAGAGDPAAVPAAPKGNGADVNAQKPAGLNATLLIAKSFSSGVAAAGGKNGKVKSDEAKATGGPGGTATPDLLLLAPNTLVSEAATKAATNGTQEANGEAESATKGGLAVGGMTPEALHASAAGTSDNATNPTANNFAFAVRLTSNGAAEPQTEASEAAVASPLTLGASVQSAGMAVGKEAADLAGSGAHTGEHTGEGAGASEPGAVLWAGEAAPSAATAQSGSSSAPAPVAATESEPATPTEPLRNIRLQLAGDNNQRVDIRLVEVGGEMRVSVRAGDTKLAQTLQEHIPDLSNRLDGQGVRADIWSPRTESPAPSSNSNGGGDSSRGGDTPGEGGQGQQRQGNGRQQQNQPDWVDELENYSSRTTTTRSN